MLHLHEHQQDNDGGPLVIVIKSGIHLETSELLRKLEGFPLKIVKYLDPAYGNDMCTFV